MLRVWNAFFSTYQSWPWHLTPFRDAKGLELGWIQVAPSTANCHKTLRQQVVFSLSKSDSFGWEELLSKAGDWRQGDRGLASLDRPKEFLASLQQGAEYAQRHKGTTCTAAVPVWDRRTFDLFLV